MGMISCSNAVPSKDVFPYKLQSIPKGSLFFPGFLEQTPDEMQRFVLFCHSSERTWKGHVLQSTIMWLTSLYRVLMLSIIMWFTSFYLVHVVYTMTYIVTLLSLQIPYQIIYKALQDLLSITRQCHFGSIVKPYKHAAVRKLGAKTVFIAVIHPLAHIEFHQCFRRTSIVCWSIWKPFSWTAVDGRWTVVCLRHVGQTCRQFVIEIFL